MYKILIVEDDPDIVELLKNRLECAGYQVITACDGEDGFSKFLKERPDLIILDLGLPKISGYEVCRRIRREKEDKTPILMLTAKNEDADKIVGRLKGADKYMTKPFNADELLDEVKRLLTRRYSKKILVVDDDPNIVELLEIRLEAKGYEVITAFNGVEAYAKAKEEKPDLIVLDAAMPIMDGYQFAQEARWKIELKDIPILILTARANTRDIFDAMGVAHFLTKPFDSKELLDMVAECLS